MSAKPGSQPQVFHCPNCGASLPDPERSTVRCQYCNTSVLVPPEYIKKSEPLPAQEPTSPEEHIVIHIGSPAVTPAAQAAQARAAGRAVRWILVIVGLVTVIGIISAVLATAGGIAAAWFGVREAQKVVNSLETTQVVAPTRAPRDTLAPESTPTATPLPFASLALQFGEKGSGPGLFDDPRDIAVDLDGSLYVADYASGRVQKFGPDGKFAWLLQVPAQQGLPAIVTDLAVDTAGKLYIVSSGDILIFNTADGTQTGSIPGDFPTTRYRYLALDAANNLFAVHEGAASTDLLRLDENGAALLRIESAVYNITKAGSSIEALAVDGLGNSYLLDRSAGQIFKFDTQGQFVDRIGAAGDAPGQLHSPLALAVDGKGRIFVVDFDGIDVFDADGSLVDTIPWRGFGAGFDIAADNQGGLYLVSNLNMVVKFTINNR